MHTQGEGEHAGARQAVPGTQPSGPHEVGHPARELLVEGLRGRRIEAQGEGEVGGHRDP